MRLREDFIHFSVRHYLRQAKWHLIAGQYPNGSDDELPALHILDYTLARDNSPDHRRHSLNKLVPDLVAHKDGILLFVEMKPAYSMGDEMKLIEVLDTRRSDLIDGLEALVSGGRVPVVFNPKVCGLVPCLGFSSSSKYSRNTRFCYFLVDTERVTFVGNDLVPSVF